MGPVVCFGRVWGTPEKWKLSPHSAAPLPSYPRERPIGPAPGHQDRLRMFTECLLYAAIL